MNFGKALWRHRAHPSGRFYARRLHIEMRDAVQLCSKQRSTTHSARTFPWHSMQRFPPALVFWPSACSAADLFVGWAQRNPDGSCLPWPAKQPRPFAPGYHLTSPRVSSSHQRAWSLAPSTNHCLLPCPSIFLCLAISPSLSRSGPRPVRLDRFAQTSHKRTAYPPTRQPNR
jgi:hypothetical protein